MDVVDSTKARKRTLIELSFTLFALALAYPFSLVALIEGTTPLHLILVLTVIFLGWSAARLLNAFHEVRKTESFRSREEVQDALAPDRHTVIAFAVIGFAGLLEHIMRADDPAAGLGGTALAVIFTVAVLGPLSSHANHWGHLRRALKLNNSEAAEPRIEEAEYHKLAAENELLRHRVVLNAPLWRRALGTYR